MDRHILHGARSRTAKLAKAVEYQLLPCIKTHVISHISDIVSSALIAFSIPCMSVQFISFIISLFAVHHAIVAGGKAQKLARNILPALLFSGGPKGLEKLSSRFG